MPEDTVIPRRKARWSRREALSLALGAAMATSTRAHAENTMLQRAIPRTGELVSAVGMGTWSTFDVDASEKARAPLRDVLRVFFGAGGQLIDSSPMYGESESVVGDLLKGTPYKPFLATKVWTQGQAEGVRQMEDSMRRMGTTRMDLMQVHNLVDWRTHLKTLRAWKEQGRIRYIGVTHYQLSAFAELESIMRHEDVDFIQLPYSLGVREAEKRLLPVAAEKKVAVLVMRPLEGGGLFSRVRNKPLPPWAGEMDCTSWAQFFLKFILAHPAVTAPIPATARPAHMADNMAVLTGRLPDEKMRKRMVAEVEG